MKNYNFMMKLLGFDSYINVKLSVCRLRKSTLKLDET